MKTTLSIIIAALVSGAAYGGNYDFLEQMRQQEYQAQVHEQLEEIQAQQRQIRAQQSDCETERWNRRLERERYLRHYVEDCE